MNSLREVGCRRIMTISWESHARWMCLDASLGSVDVARLLHIANVLVTSAFSIFLSEAESISSWSGSVAAAEAKERALLTPSPPMWTDNESCFHCTFDSWTLRIVSSPDLTMLSNSCRWWFPAHEDVRRMYTIFGIPIEFLRRQRASWDGRSDKRLIDFSRMVVFSFNAASTNVWVIFSIHFKIMQKFRFRYQFEGKCL